MAIFALLADFLALDEHGAARALFRSSVDSSHISDSKHAKSLRMVCCKKQKQKKHLDVMPQAGNSRQAIYHSSQWWKNEQNTCKPWDVEDEEKDDFIADASYGREAVSEIHQALVCLAVALYNFSYQLTVSLYRCK